MSEAAVDCPAEEMRSVYRVSLHFVVAINDIAFRGETAGLENLPRRGGYLIAANHMSHLDPPVIGLRIPRQIVFFARKTLWKGGFASWWLDAVEAVPVDRDSADVKAMRAVMDRLKSGRVIILFPEGTRSRDGELQAAKAGVGLIACRTGVPVVPARVFGTQHAFGRNGPLRLGQPCHVVFGRPLQPADYDDPAAGKERYQRAADLIMQRIATLQPPQPPVV